MTIFLKQNLRYIRKSMGMTQEQFAIATGLSRSTVGAYEEGRANPPIQVIADLSEKLGVSIDALVLKNMKGVISIALVPQFKPIE